MDGNSLGYYRKILPGLLGVWKAVVEQAVDDLCRSQRAWEDDVHARARAVAAAYFLQEVDGLPDPMVTMMETILQSVNGDLGDYLIADLWGGSGGMEAGMETRIPAVALLSSFEEGHPVGNRC